MLNVKNAISTKGVIKHNAKLTGRARSQFEPQWLDAVQFSFLLRGVTGVE